MPMDDTTRDLVFCGSCEHFATGYSDRQWEACLKAKRRPVYTRNYRGESTLLVPESPAEKNEYNDCDDFEQSKYFAKVKR